MRTRSNFYPSNSTATIPKRSNRRRIPNIVEPEIRTIAEIVLMANRIMEELLQAPTEGYGEAIVILEILAKSFEIKTNLLQLVQAKKFHGFERDNPYTHISNFKRMTATLKYKDVPNDALFPYSLEGGNLLNKTTREALKIIENKSKVPYSRSKSNVSRVNTNSRDNVSKTDDRIDKLVDQISNLVEIVNKQVIAPAKAVEKTCVTYGGAHAYYECIAIDSNSSSVCVATDEQNTKEILDKELSNSSGSTTQVQPSVVPISILEPDVLRIQTKPTIRYPSSIADALLLMLKFTSTIKSLLTNKEKHFELTKVLLNENCSAMLLKKLPEKLGDPGKFLIPCDFPRMEVCHALADLGASINLMPLSIWKKLSLPELTPTRMTLELADRSITRPKRVVEDVFVKVGKFHFPTDFVVVDFEADPRVPLILDRSFLRTGRALIDVYGEEITVRVNDESITFNLNQTMRYSSTYDDTTVNRVDVIDIACEEFVRDVLDFQYNSKSSSPTLVSNNLISESDSSKEPIVKSSSPTLTPFGESDFFLEEIEDFLNDYSIPTGIENSVYDPERDILFLENPWVSPIHCVPKKGGTTVGANENNELIPTRLVTGNEFYCFLDGFLGYFQIPIDPQDQEKTTFTCPYRRMPFGLCNAPGHKISKSGIEVDRAKVDVIAKLPHPTTVKGVMSFLGHAGFYRRFIQDFLKIARPMTYLLKKETPFVFFKECIDAFNTLKKKLTEAPILVVPDWNLPFELMCDTRDYAIGAVLGQHNSKHFQPIHYASKTMTEAQIHYTTTEKEMLTVVYAFEKFRPYLVLSKSIVYTNHSALKYFLNKQDAKPSDRGTHFYNDQFSRIMIKYGVTHRLATAYHPQTSVQVEVSNIETNLREDGGRKPCLEVLLFNSRLKIFLRKLKTRWSGPFTVTRVFLYATIELSQPNGLNLKVNGHCVKYNFGGDIPSNVTPDLHTFPMDN
nr:DNA-directed DNA polymerase [Tanacetum cinerariifolium]